MSKGLPNNTLSLIFSKDVKSLRKNLFNDLNFTISIVIVPIRHSPVQLPHLN